MGEYSNKAAYPVQQVVEQKAIVEHVQKDKFQVIVNTIGENIGWGWVFALFIFGFFIGLTVIFKTQVKRRFGEWLKFLSDWINK